MIDFPIRSSGEFSRSCLAHGLASFKEVTQYVRSLPYGRTSDPQNLALVISEQRGTCSSKHALLVSVAREQEKDISLRLGFYEMDGENTPGIGDVLQRYSLDAMVEGHCYLAYDGSRFDYTREAASEDVKLQILSEEDISPLQIGDYKNLRHRQVLQQWLLDKGLRLSLDEAWKIREECIRALGAR